MYIDQYYRKQDAINYFRDLMSKVCLYFIEYKSSRISKHESNTVTQSVDMRAKYGNAKNTYVYTFFLMHLFLKPLSRFQTTI